MKKINFNKKQKISALIIAILVIVAGAVFLLRDTEKGNDSNLSVENNEETEKESLVESIVEETDDYVVLSVDALVKETGVKFVSEEEGKFTLKNEDTELVFTVDSDTYTVNGEEKTLKAPVVKTEKGYGVEAETVLNELGFNITISRTEGKVSEIIVQKKGNISENDTKEDVVSLEVALDEKKTMYVKANINVRSDATSESEVVAEIKKGQEVTKIADKGDWSKIEFDGKVGYVKTDYLSETVLKDESASSSDNNDKQDETKPSTNNNQNTNTQKPNNSQGSNNNQSTGTGNNSSSNGGSNASSGTTQTPQKPEEKPNETPKEEPKPEPAPEPQKPASMYSNGDSISKQRFNGCASILRSGKAGAYAQVTSDYINYFDSIYIASPTTNGAWFMISVHDWPSASYPDDLDPEVIAAYKELPGLVRSCITTVAPEGGAGLYSTVSSLINSYGSPRNVPTQGKVSESIPGLYVKIVNARSEMQIFFYAE